MKLTAADRRALPAKDFAGPNRSFPVNDANHAKLAKAMAARAVVTGRMPASTEKKIDAKANKELGK